MERKSLFMMDSSEGVGHKESVMDFVISWMVRFAEDSHAAEKPLLHAYCRRFVSLLLGKGLEPTTRIVKVETWKQWHLIDLWIRISLVEQGKTVQHDILVEDKVYADMNYKSMKDYKADFDKCLQEEAPETNKHYLLLTCIDSDDAKNLGFKVIPWDVMHHTMFGLDAPK